MAKGKKTCKMLKEIRKEIARSNDIAYVTTECKYQGDCSGTCPKCEAEVRYLEEELEKRRSAGKKVVLAGVAAAMLFSAGCEDIFSSQTVGDLQPPSREESQPIPMGAPVEYASSEPKEETAGMGQISQPEESGEQSSEEISLPVFMGDLVAPEE